MCILLTGIGYSYRIIIVTYIILSWCLFYLQLKISYPICSYKWYSGRIYDSWSGMLGNQYQTQNLTQLIRYLDGMIYVSVSSKHSSSYWIYSIEKYWCVWKTRTMLGHFRNFLSSEYMACRIFLTFTFKYISVGYT